MSHLALDQKGPKVVENSVRVYKGSSALRISSDLLVKLSKSFPEEWLFECHVDIEKQSLNLRMLRIGDPLPVSIVKGYKPTPKAKCLLIPIREILTRLEINKKEVPGEYPASVVKGSIVVYFGRKL